MRALHEYSTAAVRANGKLSEKFSVTSGVRQGCVLAPTLFNFYFDVAIRMALEVHCQQGNGIRVAYLLDADLVGNRRVPKPETLVTDLEYTDNMALLANNWSDRLRFLGHLSRMSEERLPKQLLVSAPVGGKHTVGGAT